MILKALFGDDWKGTGSSEVEGILDWAAIAVAGYLAGSVNIAIIITKLIMHDDVREKGSKNAGAMNVTRCFGPAVGLMTLLGDMAKTLLAMWIGSRLAGPDGMALGAFTCMIGHCWPVFFGWRGGKGVSVAAGIALMLNYRLFLALLVIYAVVMLVCRIGSVCSMVAVTLLPFAMLIWGDYSPSLLVLGFVTAAIVIFMHRGNISRLTSGTESRMTFKKKK